MILVDNYLINSDLYSILLRLKNEYGYPNDINKSEKDIRVTCPFHAGGKESHPSCFIYTGESTDKIKEGTFHCFTCGEKGSFSYFVSKCMHCSESKAKIWLIENYGVYYYYKDADDLKSFDEIDKSENIIEYDESILNQMEDYHPYMKARHLTDDVIKEFKVKYDPLTESIVFPSYDLKGRLRSLSRRYIFSRKFDLGKGLDKSVIYLLNSVIAKNYKYCIVCESQINALTCWGWGYPAIALYGAGTTDAQLNVLNKTDISTFILAYDPDEAGRIGAKRFCKGIHRDRFVEVLDIPQGKDVNDLTKEEFDELLKNKNLNFLLKSKKE